MDRTLHGGREGRQASTVVDSMKMSNHMARTRSAEETSDRITRRVALYVGSRRAAWTGVVPPKRNPQCSKPSRTHQPPRRYPIRSIGTLPRWRRGDLSCRLDAIAPSARWGSPRALTEVSTYVPATTRTLALRRRCRALAAGHHNPRVGGSSPSSAILVYRRISLYHAGCGVVRWCREDPARSSEPLLTSAR